MYKNTTEPGLVLPQDTPVETITRTFRSHFTNALDRTGIFKLIAHTHSEDLLVLNYHSILEHQYPQPFRYHHTAGEFAAHLEWLGRNCEPVGLEGVRKWLEGQWTNSKPPALITFDDGYRSSATIAADLLSRKGMPAVFFLSTDYIGRDRVLWPDVLFARILAWTSGTLRLPEGTTTTVPDRENSASRWLFAFSSRARTAPRSSVSNTLNTWPARHRRWMSNWRPKSRILCRGTTLEAWFNAVSSSDPIRLPIQSCPASVRNN